MIDELSIVRSCSKKNTLSTVCVCWDFDENLFRIRMRALTIDDLFEKFFTSSSDWDEFKCFTILCISANIHVDWLERFFFDFWIGWINLRFSSLTYISSHIVIVIFLYFSLSVAAIVEQDRLMSFDRLTKKKLKVKSIKGKWNE